MKTYKNVTGINREDLDQDSLFNAIKEQVSETYPSLQGNDLISVSLLMLHKNKDVFCINGKYTCGDE